MNRAKILWVIVLLFLALPVQAEEGGRFLAPSSGLAMHGAPKYAEGFRHFDYANPSAPKGGTLRLGVVGSFDSLHPFIVRGTTPQAPAFSLFSSTSVYESLMARSWDEPFSLYGLIAQSVEVAADRSAIIFTLRPEARWQDGLPITAQDVLFSFETLRDRGRPNHRTFYKKVAKAEILGERRIRFDFLKNPDTSIDREMPLIMGLMPVLPKHFWVGKDFTQTSLAPPLGSGPYRVTTVEPGRSLVLTRLPDYWGRDLPVQKGLYNFDTVRIDYYRDDGVALQAFRAGGYDLRRELDAKKWVKLSGDPAVQSHALIPQRFAHKRTEALTGLILNTRRPLFQDIALRKALALAFDFDWINKTLFHGLALRTESIFPNAELAAGRGPLGQPERALLAPFKTSLPSGFLEGTRLVPSGASLRDRLLEARRMLADAGYTLKDGKLITSKGEPVAFEVMLADPAEEKIALSWSRNLERLGIGVRVRTVDSAQYQARLTGFDYDVTTGRWYNSLSPGNEQVNYWGCASVDAKGSRNYAGLCHPAVDAMVTAILASKTRSELVVASRALDRAVMALHVVVPFSHLGVDPIAYWKDRVVSPEGTPLYGPIIEAWSAPPASN